MNNTDTTSVGSSIRQAGKLWRPVRAIGPVSTSGDQIQRLQVQVANLETAVSTPVSGGPTPDAPAQVFDVMVSVTPKNIGGSLKALVAVSFSPNTNFASAQVWFTGYNGTNTPQLMAQGSSSPVQFTAEITGEAVTVTVVAVNSVGVPADFETAPTVIAVLSSVGTPPPAPSIASVLVALPAAAGWEFSWNILSGLLTDVISGYWVYRSAANVTPAPPASRFQFFAQPSSNLGEQTFQDYVAGTYYYWVSAVSISGQESTLTPTLVSEVTNRVYPSSNTGTFTAPSQAYDGNEATSSSALLSTDPTIDGFTLSADETWSGFSNVTGAISSVTLEILTYARCTGTAYASLQYSLDGGSTWETPFYSLSSVAGGIAQTFVAQYVTASLPPAQDLTQVVILASCEASTDTFGLHSFLRAGVAAQNVYEARISVTHT